MILLSAPQHTNGSVLYRIKQAIRLIIKGRTAREQRQGDALLHLMTQMTDYMTPIQMMKLINEMQKYQNPNQKVDMTGVESISEFKSRIKKNV